MTGETLPQERRSGTHYVPDTMLRAFRFMICLSPQRDPMKQKVSLFFMDGFMVEENGHGKAK